MSDVVMQDYNLNIMIQYMLWLCCSLRLEVVVF